MIKSAIISTFILVATCGISQAQQAEGCKGDKVCNGMTKVAYYQMENIEDGKIPTVVLSMADAKACRMLNDSGSPCKLESQASASEIAAMKAAFGTTSLTIIGAQH